MVTNKDMLETQVMFETVVRQMGKDIKKMREEIESLKNEIKKSKE